MNETPSRIEPLFFEDSVPRPIADLVGEVQREAMSLGRDLHPDAAAELAEFVRVMNCYYSNLIHLYPSANPALQHRVRTAFRRRQHDNVCVPFLHGLVEAADGQSLTPDQKTVLAAMRDNVMERFGRPTWRRADASVMLHLDERCVAGGKATVDRILIGLNQCLVKGEPYVGLLPVTGVEPNGVKSHLPLIFDRGRVGTLAFGPRAPKPPRLVKGGKTVEFHGPPAPPKPYNGPMRFTSLSIDIDGDEVVVRAVVSKPKASAAAPSNYQRLIGRDFGYVNTITISVLEFDDPVDVSLARTCDGMTREDALERLSTHVAPPGMKILETVRMSGRNFLERVAAQGEKIDGLRSRIDRFYQLIRPIKLRLRKELGVDEKGIVPKELPGDVRDFVRVWHRDMFRLLDEVGALKRQRIAVYRQVDGLKRSWFGFLSNMETRMALAYGAAHVREDLTVMAKEKKRPGYRSRAHNRMTNNGSKGQYIRRADGKFFWHGVTGVTVPSWFTSTHDHRHAIVEAKQRVDEFFTARIDGVRQDADQHASVTIGCWLALVPICEEHRRARDMAHAALPPRRAMAKKTTVETTAKRQTSDKRSSKPGRHAA